MIQIVIPMGGEGKRFAERGYTFPKPLIEIGDRPMIEVVVKNLAPSEAHKFVFVCRHEHLEHFALGDVLQLIAPSSEVVPMHRPTAGALCSVLLAVDHLKSDDELLIANADQYVDVTIDGFLAAAREGCYDGYIMTFPSTHPKWSYVRIEGDHVVAVAEKQPISRHATAGLYYFRRGSDFLAGAESMLTKRAVVGAEFYVAPVYNELILMGRRIGTFPITREQMHGLGTPEDLEAFASTMARMPG